ncbi:hypothetical protein ACFL2D_02550 [Patescibacteria group bacterium]
MNAFAAQLGPTGSLIVFVGMWLMWVLAVIYLAIRARRKFRELSQNHSIGFRYMLSRNFWSITALSIFLALFTYFSFPFVLQIQSISDPDLLVEMRPPQSTDDEWIPFATEDPMNDKEAEVIKENIRRLAREKQRAQKENAADKVPILPDFSSYGEH